MKKESKFNLVAFMTKYSMVIALAVVFVLFYFLTNGRLLYPQNVSNLMLQNGYVLVMACGMLLCILLVIEQSSCGVDTRTETTTIPLIHTIVISVVTGFGVGGDGTVLIIKEYRIDRRNTIHVSKAVIHVVSLPGVIEIRIGVGNIHTTFQPFLGFVIQVTAHCETIVVRTDIVTLIL